MTGGTGGTATADALDEVAAVARRLTALLAAGIAPERAWAHLAEPAVSEPAAAGARSELGSPGVLAAGARAAAGARDVAAAVRAECEDHTALGVSGQRAIAWRLFAATWSVAAAAGVPLAECLRRFAASLERAAGLHRELAVAFSGPRSTARLVGALPVVALLFGLLLGFDTPHVLAATPVGWACLVAGTGAMVLSRRWSGRMLARAAPRELVPGLEIELTAMVMASGAAPARSRALVAEAVAGYAPFLPDASRAADAAAIDAVLELATRAGVPAVGLLRAEAERRRADADVAGRRGAASVAVRLMIPLAVCVLPAFMLLGVVPVLVALLSSTGIDFG